jgi:RND family efflux transporter MFP subunit
MDETLAQSWLTLQCRMIPNVARGIASLNLHAEEASQQTASWPTGTSSTADLTTTANEALQRKALVMRTCEQPDALTDAKLCVARPFVRQKRIAGVVALELKPLSKQGQQVVLHLLQWGSAWLELLLRRESRGIGTEQALGFQVLTRLLEHDRLQPGATAAATEIAHRLGCERVSFGFLNNRRLRLTAVSRRVDFEAKANLVRTIESAMEEALAQKASITYPAPPAEPALITQAHARLAEQTTHASLCTIPLYSNQRALGALTLERAANQPFTHETVELCQHLAALSVPLLEMKRLRDRPWLGKAREALVALAQRLFGPRELRLKAVAALLASLAAFLAFATGEYRIAAPATVEGAVQRAVVAPHQGFIAAAHVRAGESVKQGEVLAELDDRELRLEHRKWTSQREELAKKYQQALARLDHSQVRIYSAQRGQAQAQLDLVEEKLARSRLVAPLAGVIIAGDLSRSLGTPVERGQVLFEIAPLEAYRVALEVDERDIADIVIDQRGYLTLSAMPGERLPLVVEKISGISDPENPQNAFRVEARLEQVGSHLRPGMRGIGKVAIGERKLFWIWTRRLVGWTQFWLWSWLP